MQIITNHHWRNFLYGYELPAKIKADFDWIDDIDGHSFIKYRDWYYSIDDFMALNNPGQPSEFENWHGCHSDSFFSGVLLRLSDDGEQYQIATYIS